MSAEQYSVKYRPKTLDELVAAPALKKQVSSIIANRNAHAILITGPTGTGKTTTARIIARGINNCQGEVIDDVVEKSLFTDNKKDDMKSIVQTMRLAPSREKNMRIFILDEAHGATGGALSELLKILEEPPHDRVMIILCTNEPWRLNITLINRCVPIVLKTPSREDMVEWLRKTIFRIGKDYPKSKFANLDKPERRKIAEAVAANCGDTLRMALQLLQSLNNGEADLKDISNHLANSTDVTADAAVARIMLLWMRADNDKLPMLIKTIADNDAYILLNRLLQCTNGLLVQLSGGPFTPQIYPVVKIIKEKTNNKDLSPLLPKLASLLAVLSNAKVQTMQFADNPANVVLANLSTGFLKR